MAFYIESADRPRKSALPDEDIPVGLLVHKLSSGMVQRARYDDETFDGVADQPHTGEQIAEREDQDDSNWDVYEADEEERVVYGGDEDGARIKVRTADDNDTDPAPDIADADVVGIADNGDEYHGRLVEEGYEDDGGTTYERGEGNFLPVGKVYRDSADGFDDVVRVEVRRDL